MTVNQENTPQLFLPHLLHSDERILDILKSSNEYLTENGEVHNRINICIRVVWSLLYLLPVTMENLFSGHTFPIAEVEYEAESSVVFCKIGFYKHAIIALRNVFELGLLSVYWDVDQGDYNALREWIVSIKSTPFRKEVSSKLREYPNIQTFDDKKQILQRTEILYGKLSNFSHTRGFRYSGQMLNNRSNVNSFNEESLHKWLILLEEVVEVITIFHILKYPVALQNTPIDAKFGINPPIGLLRPSQTELIKKFITSDLLEVCQEISDNDPEAVAVARSVKERPDITEDEMWLQIEKQDKEMIESWGFEHWWKNCEGLRESYREENSEEAKEWLHYADRLRQWSKENNFFIKGKHSI